MLMLFNALIMVPISSVAICRIVLTAPEIEQFCFLTGISPAVGETL